MTLEKPRLEAGYKPISDYGVIGDMHSAALVGLDGSIDWYCTPRFDSPSVFAAILDARKGGKFQLAPVESYTCKQSYLSETNILVTEFETADGKVRLTDFMPCFMEKGEVGDFQEIHRILEGVKGEPKIRLSFEPRLNFARGETVLAKTLDCCVAKNQNQSITLASSAHLQLDGDQAIANEFLVSENRKTTFVLKTGENPVDSVATYETSKKLEKTSDFWTNWVSQIRYQGQYRDAVVRSCLVLKMLQYAPTGAMVAAVTTSLPETIGGLRNWDYRYSWIRDSALSVWALSSVGATKEALDYARYLIDVRKQGGKELQIMTGIGGERELPEEILDHLEGYRGSSPVRIGNGAFRQLQFDVHGILVDSMYFLHRALGWTSKEIYEDLVRYSADRAALDWNKPDSGIWEIRQARFFVESTMWCYIALDRAITMAKELGYEEDRLRWETARKKIRQAILTRGWSEKKKAFTMEFGGEELDASHLLMPLVRFLPARHPKMISTIERIREELSKNEFLFRYKIEDGQLGREGAFTICSFWLVDCLTRLGRLSEAEELLDKLLSRANHLGLYSEEIDPETGEALGNFPQAYTHIGLIGAAVRLDEARHHSRLSRYATALSKRVRGQ